MSIDYLSSEHWPHYASDEVDAVAATLRSGKVNQWTSDAVFRFEDACRDVLGGGQGIALANGSLALCSRSARMMSAEKNGPYKLKMVSLVSRFDWSASTEKRLPAR